MRISAYILLLAICSSCCLHCSAPRQTGSQQVNSVEFKPDTVLFIDACKNLNGSKWILPKNSTLYFRDGGSVVNGTIDGRNSSIEGTMSGIFSNVTISGLWNVDEIKSSMFTDITKTNVLKQLFALTNNDVANTVYIDKGDYEVSAPREWGACIEVGSNTDIVLNGHITMLPNDYKGCQIINLSGDNIKLHGSGRITGDKELHTGTGGEWGMGVNVRGGINVCISGIDVDGCWGDCIYVGSWSKDIIIEDCKLDNSRRQGISVTCADGVVIRNCVITNIKGTNPQYAIDLEPNPGDTVKNVKIYNVKVSDCVGGFLTYHPKEKSSLENIYFESCSIKGVTKDPIKLWYTNDITIRKCAVDAGPLPALVLNYCDGVKLENNEIVSNNNDPIVIKKTNVIFEFLNKVKVKFGKK